MRDSARNVPATRHAMCKLCDKVLRPHGDCMFCPECGELFAKIDVPTTSPDGDQFGYVTTGTSVRRGLYKGRTEGQRVARKTQRRVKKPQPIQGALFDG